MLSVKNKMMVMALIVSSSGFAGRIVVAAPQQTVSTQLGLALPLVGDLKNIADPGISIGVQAMQQMTAHDKYGIGLSYFSFGKDSADQVDTEVSVISTLALLHHDLGGNGHGAPFIESGFGFARTQVNISATNAGGPAVLRGSNEEDISPTFLLGVGFDTPISNNATFGVSVDYQHFFFKVGDVDGGGALSILANLRM